MIIYTNKTIKSHILEKQEAIVEEVKSVSNHKKKNNKKQVPTPVVEIPKIVEEEAPVVEETRSEDVIDLSEWLKEEEINA